jgi:hypothetical protein
MLQDQADNLMREEISDADDYVDWLQWVSDAEERRQISREPEQCAKVPALLQIHRVSRNEAHSKQSALSPDCQKMSTRWEKISQKIRIDHNLGNDEKQQLWKMLGGYQDVFAWNKESWVAVRLVSIASTRKDSRLAKPPLVDYPTRRKLKSKDKSMHWWTWVK